MSRNTFTFQLRDRFLTEDEQEIFDSHVKILQLEENIWEVFEVLFQSETSSTRPLLLMVYQGDELVGVSILIECKKYGMALFSNKHLAAFLNAFRIPCYLWIKFSCCMDMMSNMGFVKDPEQADEIFGAMIEYIKRKFLLSVITDYVENSSSYDRASVLPALPHALIDTSGMSDIEDYLKTHKNIKKKIRRLQNKGGVFEVVKTPMDSNYISSIESCFVATAEKSVFYLPYQDLYLQSALKVSKSPLRQVYYFVVKIHGEIIGYQAAILSGKYLNALHGAFDRNRSTNHHAYDVLFVKMTEFALEHQVELVDFGAVLNATKQRMVNQTRDMSYFVMSKYAIIQRAFNLLLKNTRIQSKEQLQFRQD